MSSLRLKSLLAGCAPARSAQTTMAMGQRFAGAARRAQSTTSQSSQSIEAQIAGTAEATEATEAPAASQKASSSPDTKNRPRWSYTPERMKAPFPLRQPKDPRRSVWTVNEDPARLDRMYERLIGRELTRTLPEELKWLAVTHKSFDNGRRGFNTRLAYFGRMVVGLETTKKIMVTPGPEDEKDHYGRTPFSHPALEMVDRLNARRPADVAEPKRLAALAKEVGLLSVMRWKPRLPENLASSGIDTVAATTLYAIVGVLSLQYGGAVAGQVVRERLIPKLM